MGMKSRMMCEAEQGGARLDESGAEAALRRARRPVAKPREGVQGTRGECWARCPWGTPDPEMPAESAALTLLTPGADAR